MPTKQQFHITVSTIGLKNAVPVYIFARIFQCFDQI